MLEMYHGRQVSSLRCINKAITSAGVSTNVNLALHFALYTEHFKFHCGALIKPLRVQGCRLMAAFNSTSNEGCTWLCTLQFTLCTLYFSTGFPLYTLHLALHFTLCTLYFRLFTLHFILYTLYTLHFKFQARLHFDSI